ncbi:glycoside hydrolase family 25 protein [Actinoallomurus purpureus]|uniref:glycoside hydrolase family 25 protein n=1 Tax=Actinoallomurus purpureus TaxID=478114 RepID=UPI002092F491|nr:glycoside hydrolase family 25 protein [Actinoallomurus purpureus]MCO6011565.1 glycoside hydrolase family 25 protein [Actinoallomurus purpureus]
MLDRLMLSGVDISSYQSAIPAGQGFVVLKATEGITINDSRFAAWWKSLDGKLRGAYHFAHPSNDPVIEADHFLSVVAGRLLPGDVLVLDHETRGPSPPHDASWARLWLQRVEAKTGIRPIVYTFLSFAQEGRCAGLGGYPLWIADPSRPAGRPRVPGPWKTWALHQYSETGGIDRDVFNGDAAAWRALGQPQQQEEDMPFAGQIPAGKGEQVNVSFPKGFPKAAGFVYDNSLELADVIKAEPQAEIRYAFHHASGSWQTGTVKVGSADGGKDHSPKQVVSLTNASDVDYASFTRLDDGTRPVGWDMS